MDSDERAKRLGSMGTSRRSMKPKKANTCWRALDRYPWMVRVKRVCGVLLGNAYFSTFMTVVTLYALFANDLRLAVSDTTADEGFVVGAWLSLLAFAGEFGINALANESYLGGFYSYIDFVSTVSIFFEIPIIMAAISGLWSGDGGKGGGDQTEAAKAGKAGRVGTRASRIVRIVRLVRMVRVVKLYKMHSDGQNVGDQEQEEGSALEPSKVGKKLTEITTRRLIVMMLTMIVVLPQLQASTYVDNSRNFQDFYLKTLHQYPQAYNHSGGVTEAAFRNQVQFYARHSEYKLMYLEVCQPQDLEEPLAPQVEANKTCGTTWHFDTLKQWVQQGERGGESADEMMSPKRDERRPGVNGAILRMASIANRLNYRGDEYFTSMHVGCYRPADPAADGDAYLGPMMMDGPVGGGAYNENENVNTFDERMDEPTCVSIAMFDYRDQARLIAGMSMCKTLLIMVLLVATSIYFTRDAQVFVIGPIERMTKLVKRLSENPLDPANLDSRTYLGSDKKVRDQGYETALLEQTLERIGQLLQVGFGAAGAEIIGKNMNTGDGKLNPMIPGKKITAIYGFCDIRQFTDTTECLQEEVMVYVNKLGNLVHTVTHAYFGMANKNVGDAFLLSWKVCDGPLEGFTNFSDLGTPAQRTKANGSVAVVATHDGHIRVKRTITPSQMADAAITAFIKTQIDLHNANVDGCLTLYQTYDAILRRFGPGFSIQMGFGMHVGWAIEGAIGSDLKIDATYLSPHVEMSDRLEASSKIFKQQLNVSHWLHALATPTLSALTRCHAYIRAEGVSSPFRIYTFDVTNQVPTFGDSMMGIRHKHDIKPINFKADEYRAVQKGLHPNFIATFTEAFDEFVAGNWEIAAQTFEECLPLKEKDGPTLYHLQLIKDHGGAPPADWDGAHFLDEF